MPDPSVVDWMIDPLSTSIRPTSMTMLPAGSAPPTNAEIEARLVISIVSAVMCMSPPRPKEEPVDSPEKSALNGSSAVSGPAR